MKALVKFITIFSVVLLLAVNGWALTIGSTDVGTNITISDGRYTPQDWHGQAEDQEVEPGMQHGQQWDLEGFYYNQSTSSLSMIGGFNFETGVSGYPDYTSGDIFISLDNPNHDPGDNYGYDYVLDLDVPGGTYSVFNLGAGVAYDLGGLAANHNDPYSAPWKYVNGGGALAEFQNLALTFTSGLTDAEVEGFLGGSHYALTGFDLSFLGSDVDFYTHFTMGCGNDNLMGQSQTAPVPEPSTMLLLGSGLTGLAWYRRRKKE